MFLKINLRIQESNYKVSNVVIDLNMTNNTCFSADLMFWLKRGPSGSKTRCHQYKDGHTEKRDELKVFVLLGFLGVLSLLELRLLPSLPANTKPQTFITQPENPPIKHQSKEWRSSIIVSITKKNTSGVQKYLMISSSSPALFYFCGGVDLWFDLMLFCLHAVILTSTSWLNLTDYNLNVTS